MIEEIRYIVLIYQVHIHIRDSSIYPLNSSRTQVELDYIKLCSIV